MARRPLVLAVLCLALLAPAAQAQQGGKNAPPGNSAIDEYVETVPGATGDRAPRAPGKDASPALSGPQRAALERQGKEGEQLAQLVDATAPAPDTGAGAPKTTPRPSNRTPDATTPPVLAPTAGDVTAALATADRHAESPLAATLVAAVAPNDAGGLGIFLPLILLGSLVGMVALAMRRRRLPA